MRSIVCLVVFAVSLVFFLPSCKDQVANGDSQFYYYPQKNVYYNVESKSFLYSLNGGESWKSTTGNPDAIILGEKVVIYSTDTAVYKDNEEHRKLYAGKLYNFASLGTNVASTGPEVTERKIVQRSRANIPNSKEGDKPKKGIKKFFDKLFGKNKNK